MCYERRDSNIARECWERDQGGKKVSEYIEREALVSDLEFLARHQDGFRQSVILGVVHTINCVPAADVAPVVHGRWNFDAFTAKYGNPYRCSHCKEEYADMHNYCPNCGARMDGAE